MKRKSSISVRIASILLAAVLCFTSGGMSVLAQETQANPGNQAEDENGIMGDTDTVEGNTDETGTEPEENWIIKVLEGLPNLLRVFREGLVKKNSIVVEGSS